jgi:hypothetical protein
VPTAPHSVIPTRVVGLLLISWQSVTPG